MVLEVATVVTPNLPEAARLSGFADAGERQRRALQSLAPHILLKGGHAGGAEVINLWLHGDRRREWRWPRLAGAWHGSGCTLAAALAARLARGAVMAAALDAAQVYCQAALGAAYRITDGQLIPQRRMSIEGNIA